MKKISLLFLIIFLGSLLLFPLFSLAGTYQANGTTVNYVGLVPCGGPGERLCQFCHFFVMFDGIIDFVLFKIVPPLATLMIVFGGIMFFATAESPEKINEAKKLMSSAVLGLVIIYGAWLLISLFFSIIGLSEVGLGLIGPDKWFIINCPM